MTLLNLKYTTIRWEEDIKIYHVCVGRIENLSLGNTQASNLGYLAPPQGNFSWVPNCSLGPPGWETKVSLKNFGLGYVKLHGFYANP